MKDSLYHSLLRISSITIALVLLFESGLVNPITKQMSGEVHEYLSAAVGIGASVEPNELNQMTAKLAVMEKDLQEREEVLREREIAVSLNNEESNNTNSDVPIYVLSVILFILLVLIVLNYVLDYMRRNTKPVNKHEPAT